MAFPEKRYAPLELAGQTLGLAFWMAVLAYLTLFWARAYLALATCCRLGGAAALALAGWAAASFVNAWRPPRKHAGGDRAAAAAAKQAGAKEAAAKQE